MEKISILFASIQKAYDNYLELKLTLNLLKSILDWGKKSWYFFICPPYCGVYYRRLVCCRVWKYVGFYFLWQFLMLIWGAWKWVEHLVKNNVLLDDMASFGSWLQIISHKRNLTKPRGDPQIMSHLVWLKCISCFKFLLDWELACLWDLLLKRFLRVPFVSSGILLYTFGLIN